MTTTSATTTMTVVASKKHTQQPSSSLSSSSSSSSSSMSSEKVVVGTSGTAEEEEEEPVVLVQKETSNDDDDDTTVMPEAVTVAAARKLEWSHVEAELTLYDEVIEKEFIQYQKANRGKRKQILNRVTNYLWCKNLSIHRHYHQQNNISSFRCKLSDALRSKKERTVSKISTTDTNTTTTATTSTEEEASSTLSPNDRQWNKMFSLLKSFYEKYNHTKVVQGNVLGSIHTTDYPGLYAWTGTQREMFRQGKLTKERKAKLDSVRFVFEISSSSSPRLDGQNSGSSTAAGTGKGTSTGGGCDGDSDGGGRGGATDNNNNDSPRSRRVPPLHGRPSSTVPDAITNTKDVNDRHVQNKDDESQIDLNRDCCDNDNDNGFNRHTSRCHTTRPDPTSEKKKKKKTDTTSKIMIDPDTDVVLLRQEAAVAVPLPSHYHQRPANQALYRVLHRHVRTSILRECRNDACKEDECIKLFVESMKTKGLRFLSVATDKAGRFDEDFGGCCYGEEVHGTMLVQEVSRLVLGPCPICNAGAFEECRDVPIEEEDSTERYPRHCQGRQLQTSSDDGNQLQPVVLQNTTSDNVPPSSSIEPVSNNNIYGAHTEPPAAVQGSHPSDQPKVDLAKKPKVDLSLLLSESASVDQVGTSIDSTSDKGNPPSDVEGNQTIDRPNADVRAMNAKSKDVQREKSLYHSIILSRCAEY